MPFIPMRPAMQEGGGLAELFREEHARDGHGVKSSTRIGREKEFPRPMRRLGCASYFSMRARMFDLKQRTSRGETLMTKMKQLLVPWFYYRGRPRDGGAGEA